MNLSEIYLQKYNKAKRLEENNKWREAAVVWKSIRRHEDADACEHIAESIERGDEYRAKVSAVRSEIEAMPASAFVITVDHPARMQFVPTESQLAILKSRALHRKVSEIWHEHQDKYVKKPWQP